MSAKTANVLARVEPEVKEQAESIMNTLGVPASTVINMLYKQIILTRSIPFPLTVPAVPLARNEMDTAAFDAMMEKGLEQAKAGSGLSLNEAFAELERSL